MFIATLIAKEKLSGGEISIAEDALRDAGVNPGRRSWVEQDIACDLPFTASPLLARRALEGLLVDIDIVVQPVAGRRRALLIADMDSTIISVECIDELADYAGLKTRISAITERAMRGEIGFEAALAERVALLKGLDAVVLEQCYQERVKITPGAIPLVRTMKRHGASCTLVSGGFSFFADRVAAVVGFDHAVANALPVAGGKVLGILTQPVLGAAAKQQALLDAAALAGIDLNAALAVGDGANDIPMLQSAGLGIAYHAKPAAAAAADAKIERGDLGALLYAQGYSRKEWEAD